MGQQEEDPHTSAPDSQENFRGTKRPGIIESLCKGSFLTDGWRAWKPLTKNGGSVHATNNSSSSVNGCIVDVEDRGISVESSLTWEADKGRWVNKSRFACFSPWRMWTHQTRMFLFISFHTEGSIISVMRISFHLLGLKLYAFEANNFLCADVRLVFQKCFVFSVTKICQAQ